MPPSSLPSGPMGHPNSSGVESHPVRPALDVSMGVSPTSAESGIMSALPPFSSPDGHPPPPSQWEVMPSLSSPPDLSAVPPPSSPPSPPESVGGRSKPESFQGEDHSLEGSLNSSRACLEAPPPLPSDSEAAYEPYLTSLERLSVASVAPSQPSRCEEASRRSFHVALAPVLALAQARLPAFLC
mmetsp:Transcript_18480/g.52181  ORF Transcript_18480/g.52181 Transcript_18480/m.52181 type:complete len:184 (-) Transcript_18480:161-712(-)